MDCCTANLQQIIIWSLGYNLKLYNDNVDAHTLSKARMLLELLSVRSGASRFTSETIHNDLDTFIDFIAMVN